MQNKTLDYLKYVRNIHNNYYEYQENLVISNIRKDYILVKCPLHGEYEVRADHHKYGIKCRKCNQGNDLGIFTINSAIKNKKEWSNVNSILYFINLKSSSENFYKIGVTTVDIKSRFKEFPKNYKIKIIGMFQDILYNNIIAELNIKLDFGKNRYKPIKNFRGYTECYKINILEEYYN